MIPNRQFERKVADLGPQGLAQCLGSIDAGTWVLRDFHSPNLIWLGERSDIARVGIIDFQDAVQKPQLLNSRQRRNKRKSPLDRAANPLPESPVSLACGDGVPHIVIQSPRPRLGEFETLAAKRLLQHYLPLAEVALIRSPRRQRRAPWPGWALGQPGFSQSFFVSREVFGTPIRAHHVFESGNS